MDNVDDDMKKRLVTEAIAAKQQAYAVYSNFKVGAALLTEDDEVITGCNIENASFTPTICAERVAIFKAASQGVYNFKAIAIVSSDHTPTPPCGVCRQVMAEFMDDEFLIILSNNDGKLFEYLYKDIFPMRFIPQVTIGKQDVWEELRSTIQKDNVITDDEFRLIKQILVDMEKMDRKLDELTGQQLLKEEEEQQLKELRARVYRSALDTAKSDEIVSDDERAILQKLAELLNVNDQ